MGTRRRGAPAAPTADRGMIGAVRRTVLLSLVILALPGCTDAFREAAETLESPRTPGPIPTPSRLVPGGDIRIRSPREGDDVLSPVVVRGVASTASGEVLVRVVDGTGTELAAMNTPIACVAGCRGRFEARLAFYVPTRTPGAVQALEVESDGTIVQLAEVGVTLVPGA